MIACFGGRDTVVKWNKKKIETFFREHLLGIFLLGVLISLTATLVFEFWKDSTSGIEGRILSARIEPNNIPAWANCPGAELKLGPDGKLGTRCSENEDFEYLKNHHWTRSGNTLSISFVNVAALYNFQIDKVSRDKEANALDSNARVYRLYVKWK